MGPVRGLGWEESPKGDERQGAWLEVLAAPSANTVSLGNLSQTSEPLLPHWQNKELIMYGDGKIQYVGIAADAVPGTQDAQEIWALLGVQGHE